MKITLNDPSLPDGEERYITGLGFLKNGKAAEFSKEEVEAFETSTGKKLDEAFANNPNVKLAKGGGS